MILLWTTDEYKPLGSRHKAKSNRAQRNAVYQVESQSL